jgi:hypothetical protein
MTAGTRSSAPPRGSAPGCCSSQTAWVSFILFPFPFFLCHTRAHTHAHARTQLTKTPILRIIIIIIIIIHIINTYILLEYVVMLASWSASERTQLKRDARSAISTELLRGIRLIKLSGLEAAWAKRLGGVRDKELSELATVNYLSAFSQLSSDLLSLSVPAITFGYYTLVQGKLLTPATAFAALAWIGLLRVSLIIKAAQQCSTGGVHSQA